jgi:hypothetical protein
VGHHAVPVESGVPVARKTVETLLEVEDDEELPTVSIESQSHVTWDHDGALTESFLFRRSQAKLSAIAEPAKAADNRAAPNFMVMN